MSFACLAQVVFTFLIEKPSFATHGHLFSLVLVLERGMLKASYSSGLKSSDLQDKSERGAFICSKKCSKNRKKLDNGLFLIKKVAKNAIVPINVIS